jgi:hypothetical protein
MLQLLEEVSARNAKARVRLGACVNVVGDKFPVCASTATTSTAGGVHRTLLMLLVPAYHGSTSLLSMMMSNPGISTLCKGMSWECEGGKINGHINDKSCGAVHKLLDKTTVAVGNPSNPVMTLPFPSMVYATMRGATQDVKENETKGWNPNTEWVPPNLRETEPTKNTKYTEDNPPRSQIFKRSATHEALRTWGRIWNLSKPVLVQCSSFGQKSALEAWFPANTVLYQLIQLGIESLR